MLYKSIITFLLIILFFFYSILDLQFTIGSFNIPVGDAIAIFIAIIASFKFLTDYALNINRIKLHLNDGKWYIVFLSFSLLSVFISSTFDLGIHFYLRKILFYFIIYYLGIGYCLISFYRGNQLLICNYITYSALLLATFSVISSIYRILIGQTWGILEIPYITNNHKSLAITISAHIPYLYAVIKYHKPSKFSIYNITLYISFVAIILSLSKAAWFSMLVFIVLINYIGKARYNSKIYIATAIVITITTVVLLGFFFYQIPEVVGGEVSRFVLLIYTINMFLNAPFLGNGPGSFMSDTLQQYADLYAAYKGYSAEINLDAHGLVFKVLSEIGLVGLTFYLLFLYQIIISAYKIYINSNEAVSDKKMFAYGSFIGIIILFSLNAFFGTDTYSPRLWMMVTIAAVQRYL